MMPRLARTIWMAGALALTAAVAGAAPTAAVVRVEGAGLPAYARIAGPGIDGGVEEVYHSDQWGIIPFYRPVDCVPDDFNLLQFFDVPGAFACGPQTVTDVTLWRNGPGLDPAPTHVRVTGRGAVPVWFVAWSELHDAMDDTVLTIAELRTMPSLLVGEASFYSEELHTTQAAEVALSQTVARGTLVDGRTFTFEATRSGGAGGLTHVGVSFR